MNQEDDDRMISVHASVLRIISDELHRMEQQGYQLSDGADLAWLRITSQLEEWYAPKQDSRNLERQLADMEATLDRVTHERDEALAALFPSDAAPQASPMGDRNTATETGHKPADAAPKLICPKCGRDRYRQPCAFVTLECPMYGIAHGA